MRVSVIYPKTLTMNIAAALFAKTSGKPAMFLRRNHFTE
jgi:hypothetical protein